jgi:hypothetical protein
MKAEKTESRSQESEAKKQPGASIQKFAGALDFGN